MKKYILILTGVMLLYATSALATGINVLIDDSGIKDKGGTAQSAGTYHPYKANLEFYLNSMPAPTANTGRLTVDTNSQYTKIGALNKYQLSSYDGGTLQVRIWVGAPETKGSYYGKTSNPIASGTTLPYDWTITDLRANYMADVPYAPTIGSISESMQRTGSTFILQLGIPITDGTGTDGIRETQSYSMQITYPTGTTETRAGNSVTLTNAAIGTYKFKPTATNWYGSTDGTEVTYTTLGGVGPNAAPQTYYFYVPVGTNKVVPTTLYFPAASSTFTGKARSITKTVAKASDLADAIYQANGTPIVSAICEGDASNGNLMTAIFDASGLLTNGAANDFALTAGVPVQVYTTAAGSVEVK